MDAVPSTLALRSVRVSGGSQVPLPFWSVNGSAASYFPFPFASMYGSPASHCPLPLRSVNTSAEALAGLAYATEDGVVPDGDILARKDERNANGPPDGREGASVLDSAGAGHDELSGVGARAVLDHDGVAAGSGALLKSRSPPIPVRAAVRGGRAKVVDRRFRPGFGQTESLGPEGVVSTATRGVGTQRQQAGTGDEEHHQDDDGGDECAPALGSSSHGSDLLEFGPVHRFRARRGITA